LGIAYRVDFMGRIDDAALEHEYASAHCFCHPSEQEAFGIVIVVAMAAGLPVVAARAAAIPELVNDGVTGRLVPPPAPAALAAALAEVLEDDALRESLGAAARVHAPLRSPVEHARELLEACGVAAAPA